LRSHACSESGANILEARCVSTGSTAEVRFVIEITEGHMLSNTINRLQNIESVFHAMQVAPSV